jgi:hypothetical protein
MLYIVMRYKTGSEMDDGIYCAWYIHRVWDYNYYSAIADLHTFQFTVTHALWFSVLASRLLTTHLSQSHRNVKSHLKSSFPRLIAFLAYLLSHLRLLSPELHSILFWLLFSTPVVFSHVLQNTSHNQFVRTLRKTPSSIIKERIYISVA